MLVLESERRLWLGIGDSRTTHNPLVVGSNPTGPSFAVSWLPSIYAWQLSRWESETGDIGRCTFFMRVLDGVSDDLQRQNWGTIDVLPRQVNSV